MTLRNRIAVTFLLLLSVVLAAALGVVSAANHNNAAGEVRRQLEVGASVFARLQESNRRQLTQAAQAVAADYGFREAVAAHDTETLISALENTGQRVGANRVVLTTLDGAVIAAYGASLRAGSAFPIPKRVRSGDVDDGAASMMVDEGHVFQLVTVAVRSPLPVAWISMGFELDAAAVRELADIMRLGVTISVLPPGRGTAWQEAVSTLGSPSQRPADLVTRTLDLSSVDGERVAATLALSLGAARAPFDRLQRLLAFIALLSIGAFALAAFRLARNITQPLQALTAAVDRIRAGTYDFAPGVNRRDELGVLAEGLQLMQSAVQTRDNSIRRLAYEDTLTGLMNRTAFNAALGTALEKQGEQPIAVVVINLQSFRRINEHLGYSVGDAVLMSTGRRIAALPSVQGSVARVAGDQFAAFTRLHHAAALQSWATQLLIALADPITVQSQPIDVAATLGLVFVDEPGATADDVMRWAELALERARRDKRPFGIYEAALKPQARAQLSLLGELRHALEHDEFVLYFQPKVELRSQRIAGAEVLLRWQHPTRGLLSPAEFVPFAEQTGFIRRLTRWTLDHAIAQGAAWHREGKALNLAVNISADDVADERLDARVAALLTRHQLPPSLLTLELTESGFIHDPARALAQLNAVAALGALLSIDDFGTGYSSLSQLARMPVNEVKIDRSFILELESDAEFATVVRSAIDMGHGLGLKVVAEGIESELTAAKLRDFHCDIAQGYLYARPIPRAEFEAWMAGRERVPIVALPVDFSADDVDDTVNLTTY